jgi:hypothetical protein
MWNIVFFSLSLQATTSNNFTMMNNTMTFTVWFLMMLAITISLIFTRAQSNHHHNQLGCLPGGDNSAPHQQHFDHQPLWVSYGGKVGLLHQAGALPSLHWPPLCPHREEPMDSFH